MEPRKFTQTVYLRKHAEVRRLPVVAADRADDDVLNLGNQDQGGAIEGIFEGMVDINEGAAENLQFGDVHAIPQPERRTALFRGTRHMNCYAASTFQGLWAIEADQVEHVPSSLFSRQTLASS